MPKKKRFIKILDPVINNMFGSTPLKYVYMCKNSLLYVLKLCMYMQVRHLM